MAVYVGIRPRQQKPTYTNELNWICYIDSSEFFISLGLIYNTSVFLRSFCPAISHRPSRIVSTCPLITMHCSLLQAAASVPLICFFYGLPSFFCTAVCVACSQLEKLRAGLLAIKQKKGIAELDLAANCDQKEGNGKTNICQEESSFLQEQLKECVSLHRLILG